MRLPIDDDDRDDPGVEVFGIVIGDFVFNLLNFFLVAMVLLAAKSPEQFADVQPHVTSDRGTPQPARRDPRRRWWFGFADGIVAWGETTYDVNARPARRA